MTAAGIPAAPTEASATAAEAAAPADEVAGVQAVGPLATLSNVGGAVASVLPSTGEPAALFGIVLFGLAGAGLFMRRLGRPR